MSDNNTQGLCPSCSNGIFCNTYGEYKCTVKKLRIYGYKKLADCKFYTKRPANWKEMPCRCKDCLKNEALHEDAEEE